MRFCFPLFLMEEGEGCNDGSLLLLFSRRIRHAYCALSNIVMVWPFSFLSIVMSRPEMRSFWG